MDVTCKLSSLKFHLVGNMHLDVYVCGIVAAPLTSSSSSSAAAAAATVVDRVSTQGYPSTTASVCAQVKTDHSQSLFVGC